ncbi:MAG: hypothetical protein ACRDQA_15450, partial [Nocardioidaceae bacterium]
MWTLTKGDPLSQADPVIGHRFTVHLPTAEEAGLDQDAEWCVLETPEDRRRIRFHDYKEIYFVPGLYEYLFCEELKCDSPRTVRDLVAGTLERQHTDPASLTVL